MLTRLWLMRARSSTTSSPRQECAGRGLVTVRRHARIQGAAVRADLRQDRQVRAHQPGVLHLRTSGRAQAPASTGVDLPHVWHRPRPGPQRRDQCETGRRTGGIGLRSAGKTGTRPGTARRNRKSWNPAPSACRVAAPQRTRWPESPCFRREYKSRATDAIVGRDARRRGRRDHRSGRPHPEPKALTQLRNRQRRACRAYDCSRVSPARSRAATLPASAIAPVRTASPEPPGPPILRRTAQTHAWKVGQVQPIPDGPQV